VLGAWGASQGKQKGKGKGKAGNGGAGDGPSNKAAAAAGSSRSAPSARIAEEDAVQAVPPLAAEVACGAQQMQPQPPPAGGGKKEKERQRKERQRQRKIEEAREALQVAIEAMLDAAGSVEAVEEATAEAAKHGDRSEPLSALVAEARTMIQQARAAEAERAKAATAEAAAAEAADESGLCIVCQEAAKDRAILPCGNLCLCEKCSAKVTAMKPARCPVCRGPCQAVVKIFQ
jgi:hypothetical protein